VEAVYDDDKVIITHIETLKPSCSVINNNNNNNRIDKTLSLLYATAILVLYT
jgi:hypothetical protein